MRITLAERNIIEFRLRLGLGVRAIARLLQRDHSVISREIARHRCTDGTYRAAIAERRALQNQRGIKQRKLDKDPLLRVFVKKKLHELWSPEFIAGVLKNQPPREMQGKRVSHETIYHYIYSGEGRHQQLYRFLRVARKKRIKRHSRKHRKISITQRISIHERPAHINERIEVGHWEADLLEGQRKKEGSLCVRVERTFRYTHLTKVTSKTAEETRACLEATILSLPVKTFTFDNGTENAEHYLLAKQYHIGTFFCDPHAPWQKGTVENTNKLLRQYIPKRSDAMKHLTANDIQRIQDALNNRPRKCLNYLTPNQAMQNYLRSGALVT